MLKLEPKRGILKYIELGDSISKVLSHIQINFQIYGRIEIISTQDNARNPIFLILPDTGNQIFFENTLIGIKMRFDHRFQCLEFIEIFYQSEGIKRRLPFQLKGQSLNQMKLNYNTINHMMGPTYPPRIYEKKVLLPYDGINFIFEYQTQEILTQDSIINFDNVLTKINISNFDEQDEQPHQGKNYQIQHNLLQHKIKVLIDKGIQIYFPFNVTKEPIIILFGDHQMDILRLLGNPNKEYHKEDCVFLNYLELGVDLMIGADYTLKKIILHTNFPQDPYFGFHNRCFYEIQVPQNEKEQEEEVKQIQENDEFYNNLDNYFEQNKSSKTIKLQQQKKQIDESSSAQNHQQITPFTKYSKIKEFMIDESEENSKDIFYVRNYNCGFKTHYHAFKSIIFEVMVDSDLIASVTLFKTL